MIHRALTCGWLAAALVFLGPIAAATAQNTDVEQNQSSSSQSEEPSSQTPSQNGAAENAAPGTTDETAKTKDSKPGPANVAERDRILGDLYDRLSKADNSDYAKLVETAIEKMWSFSGSDTIDLLMRRAQSALGKKDDKTAVTILNAVVGLEPKYAEGWNRRAFVHFSQKNFRAALRDIRRVLIIDPKHYKAIGGLAVILREYGRDAAALKAFRKALEINPLDTETQKAVKDLEVEVEGRAI